MRCMRAWLVRFADLFRKRKNDRELAAELESHLQMHVDDNLRAGLEPEEARRTALIRLGGLEQTKEQYRDRRGLPVFENLIQDVLFGLRMLRKNPGFTAVAVLTVALGIGANAAIFSVVNTVLLKPFAYPDPDRIVMFQNTYKAGLTGSASPTEFNWWRQQTQVFQEVSAYDFSVANLTGESFPEQIPTMHVSADFFRLCGVNALGGRTFNAADDMPNAPKAVVLAYGFWQRHFGGDPQAIGRRITLSGERYEIVGVVGPDLQNGQIAERSSLSGDIEIYQPPDVYIPFQLDPYSANHGHYFNVAGRLKPGVTLAAANAQLVASYQEYARKWPDDFFPGAGFGVEGLQHAIVGGVRNPLLMLLGAVGLVLLIACANAANLLLARGTSRKREIAIRVAVGAGRGRVVRQLLAESVILALAGGVLGTAAGYVGIRAILSLNLGNIPRIRAGGSNVSLDWHILELAMGLSMLTGILFGLVPALQSSRADLSSALKESSSPTRTGLRHSQMRALLVITETALAIVLLIGAALLIRSFVAIRQVNPGFDAHNVLTMSIALTGPQFVKSRSVSQVIHEGVRRIRALPGVEAAATACCLPLEVRLHGSFQIAGRPEGPESGGLMGWSLVSPGYFESFKIPVLRGRTFGEQDESGPPVVIINQTLAKQFWPNSDPLSDQITFLGDQSPRQIIGVVGDVREEALNRNPRPNLYLLSAQMNNTGLITTWAWVIRTRVVPLSLSSAIQKELTEASGGLPVAQVRTMEQILSRSTASVNFATLVLTIFACSALVLAAIGIYGVMSYSVHQRAQEIGIRMALGAESGRVRRMVIFQGVRLALVGIAIGIAAAFGLARLIGSFLFGVKPWDPAVFVIAPVALCAVALIAASLPARRAAGVDPMVALRHE
jgi:putative ABC transport system permease protein